MNTQTERVVEIPWLIDRIGAPENVLDIGSVSAGYLSDLRSHASGQVVCVDTRPAHVPQGIEFVQADAGNLPGDWDDKFDLVTSVSVIDHIGLEAYGNHQQDGLLEQSCEEMARVCCGRVLLTVPFGVDHLTTHPGGGQRVFDRKALGALFPKTIWTWKPATYWKLNENGDYIEAKLNDVKECMYAEYRAAAVIALELVKK